LVTVTDVVDSSLRKSPFGHNFYRSPSNEMLLKKAPFGLSNKKKYDDFQSEIQKKKGWVPSPDKYKLDINWLT
jgi:hypothetical protein